ncbi:uncharacterized protein DNG_08991 [Cephalotrichum gorgonifer]|uniref:Uncharacterized protein n=1 Tax=Cephalotrichum gorgonifer TaxID=2041049 RepID=A0AAE8SZR4_9PEZI|nr:uncharacterized protein DNG_08991 [Cephalotrichum gorgonifer]
MVANTILERAALACGILATAALAEQTAVQVWFPWLYQGDAEEFFGKAEGIVQKTIGDAVVVIIDYYPGYPGLALTPTATVGPHTYHHEYSYSYISPYMRHEDEVKVLAKLVDCTFSGCPVATTGSCTASAVFGSLTQTKTATLVASDLKFYPFTLAPPLTESLPISCGNGGGNSEANPTGSEATVTANNEASPTSGDESAPEDAPSGGWRVSASWSGLVSAVCLISAVI